MAPLHRLNPARLGFLRETLLAHFARDPKGLRPFDGLRILDIGCGGGLIAEPLTRLGATVTGIDAAEANIAVARAHARGADLEIDYRQASAEALAAAGERFDAVLALEVVEHVADVESFLHAEYVLGWLPRGTHRWDRFLRPSEFASNLRRQGLELREIRGLVYDLRAGEWRLGRDISVNYLIYAARPAH
jgi:2-polyprenyl-6-hydroxyphenyl methylase/3-demethylubiquinone-9 3-methyltransferase